MLSTTNWVIFCWQNCQLNIESFKVQYVSQEITSTIAAPVYEKRQKP